MHTGTHHPSGSLVHSGPYRVWPLPVYVSGRREVEGSMGAGTGERLLGTPRLETHPWQAKGYESDVGISNTAFEIETPVLTFH